MGPVNGGEEFRKCGPFLFPNLIRCTKNYGDETGIGKARSGVGTGLGIGTDQGLTSI